MDVEVIFFIEEWQHIVQVSNASARSSMQGVNHQLEATG